MTAGDDCVAEEAVAVCPSWLCGHDVGLLTDCWLDPCESRAAPGSPCGLLRLGGTHLRMPGPARGLTCRSRTNVCSEGASKWPPPPMVQGATWVCAGRRRGAWSVRIGVLSVLLPSSRSGAGDRRTSAGALIAAYLVANWHRSVNEAVDDGLRFWRELRFEDVFAALMAPAAWPGSRATSARFCPSARCAPRRSCTPNRWPDRGQARGFRLSPREHPRPAGGSRRGRHPAYSNRSVVFHQGG